MVITYNIISHSKAFQILPKSGFFKIENKRSGNPGVASSFKLIFTFGNSFCMQVAEAEASVVACASNIGKTLRQQFDA
jgi:hypothetical protein